MRNGSGHGSRWVLGAAATIAGFLVAASPATGEAAPDSLQPVNLALGKAARQSSNPFGSGANLAVDGNTDGNYWDGSVQHTNNDPHSYWEVDLGQVRQIGRVEIYNRTDCCQDRISPFMLMVSDNPIADADMSAIDALVTPGVMRTTVTGIQTVYYVPVNRSGRYVRVALVNQNYLHMAEVRVLEADSAVRGRATSQSSTIAGGDASNAVDANEDGVWADGSVSATNVETNPWWQVDMGAVRNIRQIDVWSSATDCCATQSPRLPLILWMSNSPITVDPYTTYAPGVWGYWLSPQGNPASITVDTSFRYMRVEAIGTDSLSLAEVQVWPVALGSDGAHASMSSLATGGDANWAIDQHVSGSNATTQSQLQPYLDIDLGGQRYVETVRLWNQRTDYHLFTSVTPFVDTSGNPVTSYGATAALPGVSQWYSRGAPAVGGSSTTAVMQLVRFVRVMLDGTTTLSLSEVEITTTEGFYTNAFNGGTYSFGANGYPSQNLLGFFPRPNTPIDVYAYGPNATSGGSYTYLGQAFSGTTPYLTVHAAAPTYMFQLSNIMIPSVLWPWGGVGGMYAIAVDNGGLVVTPLRGVDVDNSNNLFYPINRYVSVDATPDGDSPPPSYLDAPLGTSGQHQNYTYDTYVLSNSLTINMSTYFPMGNPNPAAFVQYFNVNELGLGRVVGCTRGTIPTTRRPSPGAAPLATSTNTRRSTAAESPSSGIKPTPWPRSAPGRHPCRPRSSWPSTPRTTSTTKSGSALS